MRSPLPSIPLRWRISQAGLCIPVTHLLLHPPKSCCSALSQTAIDALVRQRERLQNAQSTLGDAWDSNQQWVFPGMHGTVYTFENITKNQLRPVLRRLGLPQIRFHDLRHTFATMLISKGINIKVVSEMLGHANVSITLRVYAHVLPHLQESAAQVIDDVIGDVF